MANRKIISITILVDVVGTLTNDTLEGNVYLFDNNRANGSLGEGTGRLEPYVPFAPEEGALVWNILSMEPESFVEISDISSETDNLKFEKRNYGGTDIVYWIGTFEKPFHQYACYLQIKVGNREQPFPYVMKLIGNQPD